MLIVRPHEGNDLPAVTKLIYWIPLLAYPILTMLVGFNINVRTFPVFISYQVSMASCSTILTIPFQISMETLIFLNRGQSSIPMSPTPRSSSLPDMGVLVLCPRH